MSWLILVAHAFNPLLLHIGMTRMRSRREASRRAVVAQDVFLTVFSSFLVYLVWLGVHWLWLSMVGAGLSFDRFVGADRGPAYFLPFMLGFLMLVLEFGVRPRLRAEQSLAFVGSLGTVLLVSGCYFMFVNYLAWIAYL
ncbi:MAG: hypothetical protein WC012_14245 [Thiohalomonadaceae bacterium]